MNVRRRRFLQATGAATVAALAGCTGDDGDGNDSDGNGGGGGGGGNGSGGGGGSGSLKLGVLVPFSGEYAWVGENVLPVARLVAQEINDDGGIGGEQVSLVQGDTEASPDASLSAAKKLVNVDGVAGIIGPTSLTFSAVSDFFRENQVPVVSPTAGTTALNDVGGEYIFRTVPSDTLGGRAIAKAARQKEFNTVQSYEQMGLMVGNAQALQSFKQPISSSFEEFGGTITESLDFKTGKAAYQSEVQTMLDSDPEIITLVASPEDSVKIMQAAFQAGYEGNWFVTQDQTNQDFLEQTSEKVTQGILGLQEADNPDAAESGRVEEFVSAYKEANDGSEPGLFAKNTYDAMVVMGLAMTATAQAGEDFTGSNLAPHIPEVANPPEQTVTTYADGAAAIREGTDVNYEGLVGPIDFDDVGDIQSPFAVMKSDSNAWEQVAVLPADQLT
ncbi:ABC transporter substrate-binding protein [Halomarina litorea]|uniref:ABC transporter substrate-binding protein n=1 Tax=Halomarina litorea TaxID=2961595 RepID=UPI0020C3A376|nr:ABC transporter substrate-binding protein [Halomarina sp. BCD28]